VSSLLPFVIVGLTTGSLYGLAGVGLVLTYRTSGVFNFGHGALAAAAAFLFYTLHVTDHLAWPVAGLVTIIVFAVGGGLALERLTRTLTGVAPAVIVTMTVGIFLAVDGLLSVTYGDVTRHFPAFLPTTGFQVSGVIVEWGQVIAAAIALGASVGLYLFLRTARLGIAMRAVVDDPTLLGLTGDRPTRVRVTAWAIGSSFAALSGILLAPTLGLDASLLTLLVVQAFGACAIGLFSSLPLTYVGGLVVGVAASVSTKYLTRAPWSGLPSAVPFVVLIAVLLAVPVSRLPGARQTVRQMVPDMPPLSRSGSLALLGGGAVVLVALPYIVGDHLPVWITAAGYVVIFASLALLTWTSGQISLCHMAFVAVGATTMGHLTSAGVPWLPALLIAGLAVVPVGALVAIPAIRLSGIYLALVTLGFGILMQDVVFGSFLMFGSGLTVAGRRPDLWFIHGSDDRAYYYVTVAIAVASCAALVAIHRSRLGRLLRGLGQSPTMLATNGLRVSITRLTVFCVSAFFAGLAGGLTISQFSAVSGSAYGPVPSLLLLAVLAVCGTRLIRTAVLSAILLAVVPGYLTKFNSDHQTLVFGAAAMVAALVAASRVALTAWVNRSAVESDRRRALSPVRARLAG
jgi:ABC-type branched-subunit amino acid transport system permease subunit